MNNVHTKYQEDSWRSLEVIGQKLSKLSILAEKGQILVLNGQNFTLPEFSRHIEYDFPKENHKSIFHTKYQEDLQLELCQISDFKCGGNMAWGSCLNGNCSYCLLSFITLYMPRKWQNWPKHQLLCLCSKSSLNWTLYKPDTSLNRTNALGPKCPYL